MMDDAEHAAMDNMYGFDASGMSFDASSDTRSEGHDGAPDGGHDAPSFAPPEFDLEAHPAARSRVKPHPKRGKDRRAPAAAPADHHDNLLPPPAPIADAVPIGDDDADASPAPKAKNGGRRAGWIRPMGALAMFALFIVVISDLFVSNVVSAFGGAVSGRNTTPFGTVVQGILFVLLYAVADRLLQKRAA